MNECMTAVKCGAIRWLRALTLITLKLFGINHGPKRFIQIKNVLNVLIRSFHFILIPMLWAYVCFNYVNYFSAGTVFYTSESDVYRRQILTYKDGPRAERVNISVPTKRRRIQYVSSVHVTLIAFEVAIYVCVWKPTLIHIDIMDSWYRVIIWHCNMTL